MRIVLGVRNQQQQAGNSSNGEDGYEENPADPARAPSPSKSPPPVLPKGGDERKEASSASPDLARVPASESSGAPAAVKKASKKRGRKSPSPVPATPPSAPGDVLAGFRSSGGVGKKSPPAQEEKSSVAGPGPSRKRKHPPHKAGRPKTHHEDAKQQDGGSKPAAAAKKKARHHPHQKQQGNDRKVSSAERHCSSSSSSSSLSKPRKNMGGVEKLYRPHGGQKGDRVRGDRIERRRFEDSTGPDQADADPAADDASAGHEAEESGAIDVIRYGDGDQPQGSGENDDPAVAEPGVGLRQQRATVSTAASSSSSSSCSSAPTRRRCSPGGAPISSAAASASTGPTAVASSSASREPDDFEEALKKHGLELAEQEGDGNCLFRAVSLQVYGDATNHGEVRRRCLDFMARDEPHFSSFIIDEPFREYIQRKRRDGVHGNNPEIQAISELYNRPVEVFVPDNGAKPINIFHEEYKTADAPIRLSYHDGNHYNAVVDPLLPTAGLGLGLPGLEPGLADRLQLEKAKEKSEVDLAAAESSRNEMDRALEESRASVTRMYDKQKALAMSDMEATDYELERAVLESSMESYQRNEMGRKQGGHPRGVTAAGASMSSSSSSSSTGHHHHHRGRRGPRSTSPPASSSSAAFATSAAMSSSAVAAPSPPPAAAAASARPADRDEYPSSVQELVMNGFELPKVLRAYDLVGDNFDALLSVLMSSAT